MIAPQRLWAKSKEKDIHGNGIESDRIFLPYHLEAAYQSTLHVISATGEDQLNALGLKPAEWFERFKKVVSLAAVLHDLGKANDHFQGMLQPKELPDRKDRYQGLRHEWVTFLILHELKEWLSLALDNDPVSGLALECAITGHHPAYERPSPPKESINGGGSEMTVYCDHQDFIQSLDFIAQEFHLASPKSYPPTTLILLGSDSAFKTINKCFREQHKSWESLPISSEARRFVAACKACLISGDVAGSALPVETEDRSQHEKWIKESFAWIPKPEQISEILAARLGCDIDGIDSELRRFQRETATKAGRITFVKAGCGTGKTIAAYNWARLHCPNRRVYICYPTTGTATEGYRDYLYNPDEMVSKFGAELFSSRAEIDKTLILGVHQDREKHDGDDALIRIESLRAWSTPIVSCTVDTVLGLMQNHRRGLYAWPALAGAAFVFDEIHAYDDKLFGALLRFLETLRGVPVLFMTASLPQKRLEILRNKCQKLGEELKEIEGPKDLEEIPRYHRQGDIDSRDPIPEIKQEIERGGKILWVCNSVNRAMDAYDRAKDAGLKPVLYHSRYKYEDRVNRHSEVIKLFDKENTDSALAICTQVAEMSLDLSATMLVSDLAPVPSLIQRLGRLNRRAKENDPTRPFIVIEPKDEAGDLAILPYTAADFDSARRWLGALPQTDISQLDLAEAWEEDDDAKNRRPAFVPAAWIDGGPITQVLELRECSPGITVVCEEDLEDSKTRNKQELQKILIPMNPPPKSLEWRSDEPYRGIPVALEGTIEYDKERGAKWQKSPEK